MGVCTLGLGSQTKKKGAVRRIEDGGQASVEAAFALPVMLTMVLLLLQPAIILYDRIVMADAAAEGCRLLSTLPADQVDACTTFIRHRLAAVPQVGLFHVHDDSCSWEIQCTGDESSQQVSVAIWNKVQPLPLIGLGMGFARLTGSDGLYQFHVEATRYTQPSWVWTSPAGSNPESWAGAWL